MGVVSALLMIATVGVNYGWQPDGNNGVEYVIQIPPEQLAEIERLGEISSTIDPEVRGRVSRVIVKVGNGPLPRTTPPGFALQAEESAHQVALADHTPMPIPETGDANAGLPIRGLESTGIESVMKPQTGDASRGPGFALPAIPSTLRNNATAGNSTAQDLGSRAQSAIDAANRFGAAVEGTAAAGIDALDRAGNVLRTPSTDPRSQLQFTGNDPQGAMARTRVGGPSTEPTSPRDNSWGNLTPRGPGGPSTEPAGAEARTNFGTQNSQSTANTNFGLPDNSQRQSGTATGIDSRDMLGRLPAGITLPSTGQAANSLYPPANNGSNLQSLRTATTDIYGRPITDPTANQSQSPFATQSNQQAFGSGSQYDRAQVPRSQFNQDSQLTAAQLATMPPGTWAVDPYGRPVDRDGRLLDPSGRAIDPYSLAKSNTASADRLAQSDGARSSLGPPNTYSSNPFPSTNNATRPSDPYPYARGSSETNLIRENRSDRNSLGGPQYRESDMDNVSLTPPSQARNYRPDAIETARTASAQPLFNGLLLISFVANIYLIFWLKNLRVQFRDLIAAKRMAASNNAAN